MVICLIMPGRSMFTVEDKTDSLASKFTMTNEGCVMKGEESSI